MSDSLQPHDCSTSGFPIPHYLPEFAQVHVHWVCDAIQPSHPLPPPSPFAFSLSQHQDLFQWVVCLHWVTKVSVSDQFFNEFSGLMSFRTDWFDLLAVQETLKSFSSITIQKHQFFSIQPPLWSNSHIRTWLLEKPLLWLYGKVSWWPCGDSLVCYLLLFPCCFTLSLIFVSSINVCLSMFLLGLILYGTLCIPWTWVSFFFSKLGQFSSIISSNIFSGPFSLLLLGPAIMEMLLHLMLSERSLWLSSSLFNFSLYSILQQRFLPLCLPANLFVLWPHLFYLFLLVYFSLVTVRFTSVHLIFKSFTSLFNISCIFSVCASITFPKSWIILLSLLWILFQVGYLSPLSCSSGLLSCSFI